MSSGRYERKFLVRELGLHEVEALVRLHAACFVPPFPPRTVHNVYLDTVGFANYLDNAGGVADREKLRVRWYGGRGGELERPTLERKAKAGLLGTKESFLMASFRLEDDTTAEDLRRAFDASDLPEGTREAVLAQEPVLVNHYRRSYWLSADGRFRLTIDSELEFARFGRLGSALGNTWTDEGAIVVELKYDPAHDRDAARIASTFPFRVTKSSKYASGIERIYV